MAVEACMVCGKPVDAESTHCAACGAPRGLVADEAVAPPPPTDGVVNADAPAAGADTVGADTASADRAGRRTRTIWVAAGLVLVALAAVLAWKLRPLQVVSANAELYYFDSEVIVRNDEAEDLRNCRLTLVSGDSYIYRGAAIAAGRAQVIDAVRFKNGDALPFNPRRLRPTRAEISCTSRGLERRAGRDIPG